MNQRAELCLPAGAAGSGRRQRRGSRRRSQATRQEGEEVAQGTKMFVGVCSKLPGKAGERCHARRARRGRVGKDMAYKPHGMAERTTKPVLKGGLNDGATGCVNASAKNCSKTEQLLLGRYVQDVKECPPRNHRGIESFPKW